MAIAAPAKVIESKFMVTYTYTTGRISGTVRGEPEFFANEKDALARYTALRHGSADINEPKPYERKDLSRSSVTLWASEGWRVVIGSNEKASA